MTAASVAGRSAKPAALAPRPYRFPAFEHGTLDDSIRLMLAPVRKLPLVTLCVVAEAGAVADTAAREGIAQLTADLLLEGTERRSGAELAERFERLGAVVEAAADWDVAVVSLTALREHFGRAVELLGEVLRAPSFPDREAERLKAERRAELLRRRAEPRGLADDMFSRVLYRGTSRYARPVGGTDASVAAISTADIRHFWLERYRAGGLTVIVTGDFDAEDAASLMRATFGGWHRGAPPPARTIVAPRRTDRAIHLVAKPDAQQTELRVGHVGLPRDHTDYYAVSVMNAILGGLFSSRINLNLRERHGYTYGAFSRFDWRRQAGPFAVSTAVRSEVTAAAAREIIGEVERIREAEVDAAELSLATSYLDGVFPIRYETTESIADALVTLRTFSLADDFHDTYRERIRATTAADVLRVARQHLEPGALQLLVVGDAAVVRNQLDDLPGMLTTYQPADVDS